MVYELVDTTKAAALFGGWSETLIWSCLQKVMGKIYVTDFEKPQSALAFVGCFAFYAGEPDRELVMHKPAGFVIMTPQNEAWASLIEECRPSAKKETRFSIRKDTQFDIPVLKKMAETLCFPLPPHVIAQCCQKQNEYSIFLANTIIICYDSYMEKDIYFINENKLTYGRGYVYSLQYHIVWCTKYRRKVLTGGADDDCKKLLQEIAKEYSFRILAMEVMPDHVHVLVDAKPQFFISDMVKIMKGGIARRLFQLHPEMKEKLWGGHLWNPSYCVVTVSDRSREQVERYIESQKEKAWGGKGRPPRDLERLQRYHREVLEAEHPG